MNNKIKFLLVDDNLDFAMLLKKTVALDARLDYLGHASCKVSGIEMSCKMNPDIVVMDLNLSGNNLDGIEAAKELRRITGVKILLLTAYEQKDIIIDASIRAFASGYVLKSQFQMIAQIIYETATSNTPQKEFIKELTLSGLSIAERGVLEDMLNEKVLCTSQTARSTQSSQSTIRNQKTSIYRKLGLKNKKEALNVFKNW